MAASRRGIEEADLFAWHHESDTMILSMKREGQMHVDGSCHCGAITFESDIDPDKVRICHCTDCQQLSGTAFRVMVPCSESDFRLKTGEPKIYVKTAESGRRRQQAFCGDCGSPIYATSDEPKGARSLGLRVGVLAQRRELTPTCMPNLQRAGACPHPPASIVSSAASYRFGTQCFRARI